MERNGKSLLTVLLILPLSLFAQKSLTDQEILKMYKGLRVADVSDGMDIAGSR